MYYSYEDDIDDIATEGIARIGKSIWVTIQNIIRKIITFLRNVMKNLYYLKTAWMPKQMSEDLQTVVQMSTPRYEFYNNVVYSQIAIIRTIQKISDNQSDDEKREQLQKVVKSSLKDIIDNTLTSSNADLDVILTDIEKSEEYQRIQNKDYDFNKSVEVPLGNVIPALKKSEKMACKYEGMLNKLKNVKESSYEIINNAYRLMHEVYGKIIRVYKFQQSVLTIFIDYAKVSASALVKNIKDRKNGTVTTDINNTPGYISAARQMKKSVIRKKLTEEQYNQIRQWTYDLCEMGHDLTKYNQYKTIYSNIVQTIGAPHMASILYRGVEFTGRSYNDNLNDRKKKGRYEFNILQYPKPLRLTSNSELYHTSNDPNLEVLDGRFMFINNTYPEFGTIRLFPTPRVYASVGHAMSRDGGLYSEKDPTNGKDLYRYKLVGNFKECRRDGEFFGLNSAVYVETYSPIKVVKME